MANFEEQADSQIGLAQQIKHFKKLIKKKELKLKSMEKDLSERQKLVQKKEAVFDQKVEPKLKQEQI